MNDTNFSTDLKYNFTRCAQSSTKSDEIVLPENIELSFILQIAKLHKDFNEDIVYKTLLKNRFGSK